MKDEGRRMKHAGFGRQHVAGLFLNLVLVLFPANRREKKMKKIKKKRVRTRV
jgi:hypothetical protein